MSATSDGYRRYVAALAAASAHAPGLHVNQRAALVREAAIAAQATDAAELGRRGSAPIEIARGTQIDRMINAARVAETLDDPWTAEACAIEAIAATSVDEEWTAALVAGAQQAWPLRAKAAQVASLIEQIAVGVVRWYAERRPAERAEAMRDLQGAVAALVAIDPAVDLARPRYRWRLPWTDDGLVALHDLLRPFLAEPAHVEPVPDAAAAIARAEAAAAAWRAGLAQHVARDTAEDPAIGALADAVERGALVEAARAPLVAACHDMLARDAMWPEPLRRHHATSLAAALAAARTPTEVEHIATHAGGCFAIEAAWQHALVAALGWPLRTTLMATYEPDLAPSIADARAIAHALAGEADPLVLPWFARLVETKLVANATRDLDGFSAYLGECGFELLGPWRAWTAGAAAPRGIADARVLTAAGRTVERRRVRLWDHSAALDDVDVLREAPARPARTM